MISRVLALVSLSFLVAATASAQNSAEDQEAGGETRSSDVADSRDSADTDTPLPVELANEATADSESDDGSAVDSQQGNQELRLEPPAMDALRLDLDGVAPGWQPDLGPSLEFHDLEVALRLPVYDFDGVSFIGATRSLITAVLETYCAAGLFFPDDDGYSAVDIVLGAGCLIGAASLYYMGIRRLLRPKEQERARERLTRFETSRDSDELDAAMADALAMELRDAARRDLRRRRFEIVFGVLNIAATATLAGLTARGRIGAVTGTTIATGTGLLGVLGLGSIFARSPSERAWQTYQRTLER